MPARDVQTAVIGPCQVGPELRFAVAPQMWARLAAGALAALIAVLAVVGLASPAQADSIRDKQWYLDFLKVAQLHKITKGEDATVAVIDSGVDASHSDLKGNVLNGANFVEGGDARTDERGHGTAVASLIAGHGHGPGHRDGILGIAPRAKILPGRVQFGKGDLAEEGFDEAVDWAVEQGAGVVNLSFRGPVGVSHIENALANDVVVVASAGNTKQDGLEVSVPAAYPGVIAVSGVGRDGKFTARSTRGREVVLAAPMLDIPAAGAGKGGPYIVGDGTSYAAAIVSGAAALIRAKYPDISANGVINRLIKTADDKGPPGRDDKYGYGVINPLKALTANIPDIDFNPLIEGDASSPSASATAAPPAKADSDKSEAASYLLPVLAGTAAMVILAGLGAYFITLARRSRRNALSAGSPQVRFQGRPASHHPHPGAPPRAAPQAYVQPPPDRPSGAPHTGASQADGVRSPQRE